MRLNDKVAVITGAAGGQGQAAARLFAEEGARLVVTDIDEDGAEKTAEEVAAQDEDSVVTLLHGAVEDANTAICQANQQNKTDMGSTTTGFMIVGDLAYIFNVGDSRTYMQRDGKLYQLTNDHSLVGQLVGSGDGRGLDDQAEGTQARDPGPRNGGPHRRGGRGLLGGALRSHVRVSLPIPGQGRGGVRCAGTSWLPTAWE